MKLNFKQLLEDLPESIKYYQTVDGKAERIFKNVLDKMALEGISLEEIDYMFFSALYTYRGPFAKYPYSFFIVFDSQLKGKLAKKYYDEIPNFSGFIVLYSEEINVPILDFSKTYTECKNISEAIQNHLKKSGFKFVDLTSSELNSPNIKHLKIFV